MGTNLSQVFVSDALTALSGTTFNSSGAATDDVGVWKLDPTAGYVSTKLYATTVAEEDTAGAVAGTAIKSPLWLVNNIQIVQRGTPHFIASPLINTRNIRSIKYSNHESFVGTKATIVDATLNVSGAADNDQYNFKFIIKSTPTDQLNFYDQGGLNIFGDFPLGAFNTTNHKAINMTVVIADVDDADAANNVSAISNALADHPILGKMFTAADVDANVVITAKHPGVVFDLIIQNVSQDADPVSCNITGQVLGVGNDWQVIGEEIRCRSRYGNFNRMYFPDSVATYGQVGSKYDKITIEYATNWPSSTGIAPAGELNQAVIYYTNTGSDPSTSASEFATIFGYTQGTDKQFIW